MTTFTEERFRPIAVGPRILARELCRSEAPRNRHDSPEFHDVFATLQHWNPDVTQGYAYKPSPHLGSLPGRDLNVCDQAMSGRLGSYRSAQRRSRTKLGLGAVGTATLFDQPVRTLERANPLNCIWLLIQKDGSMNAMKTPLGSLAATVAIILPCAASGAMYKWVDEQGITNYSNKAPADRRAVKLNEQNSLVNTIRFPERKGAASPARVERPEDEPFGAGRSPAAEEAAAREAFRRWREQCIAQRRVDCDDPYAAESFYPGYIIGSPPGSMRLAPGSYRPTPRLEVGGGGVVGPFFKPPIGGGPVAGPGAYGIGGGYNQITPRDGVVVGPGSGGIGAQHYPVPQTSGSRGMVRR